MLPRAGTVAMRRVAFVSTSVENSAPSLDVVHVLGFDARDDHSNFSFHYLPGLESLQIEDGYATGSGVDHLPAIGRIGVVVK